jgi:hypothetical protein
VSQRRDQLIPVNKVVNEREQLEKGLEEEKKSEFKENQSPDCVVLSFIFNVHFQ